MGDGCGEATNEWVQTTVAVMGVITGATEQGSFATLSDPSGVRFGLHQK